MADKRKTLGRDPLNEYTREAFEIFEAVLANLRQHAPDDAVGIGGPDECIG